MKMLSILIIYILACYIHSIKIKIEEDKITKVVKSTLTKYQNPELDTEKLFEKCAELLVSDKASEGAKKDYFNHLNSVITTPNTYPSLEKLNNYLTLANPTIKQDGTKPDVQCGNFIKGILKPTNIINSDSFNSSLVTEIAQILGLEPVKAEKKKFSDFITSFASSNRDNELRSLWIY